MKCGRQTVIMDSTKADEISGSLIGYSDVVLDVKSSTKAKKHIPVNEIKKLKDRFIYLSTDL